MRCDRAREAASARLDGEALGVAPSVLDAHLAACPDCARWVERATSATRLARLAVTPVPDLTDGIARDVVLPTRRVSRRRNTLRALLATAGAAQLMVGALGDTVGMTMSAHAVHETAAWNLALGVAFVGVALTPRRAKGVIPLVATFLLVLTVLSVSDVAEHVVSATRLATHLVALVGLLLTVGVDRAERHVPPVHPDLARSHDEGGSPNLRTVA